MRAWANLGRALEAGLVRYQVWTFDRRGGRPSFADVVARASAVELEGEAKSSSHDERELAGVRVLDLTRLLPGSLASDELRRLGADVVKVELPRSADYMRKLEPRDLPSDAPHPFTWLNQGKRSLALDYRSPQGADLLRRLVLDADIVIESDRPGSLARFGLGPTQLLELKPSLVYVSMTGYGQTGPWADRPAHEMNIQAVSGYLDLSRQTAGRPIPAALPISDMAVGQQAALGIVSALLAARQSGRGRHVDVCAFDVLWRWSRAFGSGERPQGHPGRRGLLFANAWPCYQCVVSSDGVWFAAAPIEKPFWDRFCALLGRPDLRSRAYDESAVPEVHREFGARSADAIRALFAGEELCVTELVGFDEAMAGPRVEARGLAARPSAAPRLGEHTRDVLRAAGLSVDRIAELGARGVILEGSAKAPRT